MVALFAGTHTSLFGDLRYIHRMSSTKTVRSIVASLACSFVLAAGCNAQLTPDRLYYGVGRTMPMTISVPKDTAGEPSIRLYEAAPAPIAPGGAESRPAADAWSEEHAIIATAAAAAGSVNLATLFPVVWAQSAPRAMYAQLVVGSQEIGPPVVLQPMVSPKTASLVHTTTRQAFWYDDVTKKPSFDPKDATIVYSSESPIVFSGVRAYADRRVVLVTSEGDLEFALRPDAAPNTAWNFLQLVEGGFYTDIAFHRVVPLDKKGNPFVIQVGDPTGTGDGGPGFSYDLEPSTLPHDFGVISVARDTDPNTNGSQVFVCLSRSGTSRLDGKYTAFGQLTHGANAVRAIAATPLEVGTDKPVHPPVLLSARSVAAPSVEQRRGRSPSEAPSPGRNER